MFAHVRGHADAAVAGGIAGEKSSVHAHAVDGNPHEVFHVCAFVFAAFGHGVFPAVNIAVHDLAGAIHKNPVAAAAVVFILCRMRKLPLGVG
jgi:hypothetical protein